MNLGGDVEVTSKWNIRNGLIQLASVFAVAASVLVIAACSGESTDAADVPTITPTNTVAAATVAATQAVSTPAPATPTATVLATTISARVTPTTAKHSPAAAKHPIEGLCLPAVPLAVSVGDTWTISGPVEVSEGFPSELPEGTAEVSSTFTMKVSERQPTVSGAGAERPLSALPSR